MDRRRFAGARIGAQKIEDISADLRSALESLARSEQQMQGIARTVPVAGTDASVMLSARAMPFPTVDELGTGVILGNKEQIRKMQELNSPGLVELAWTTDNYSSDPRTKLRIGRTASRAWGEALADLPNGAIVRNYPVGAMQGDFERSDLYSRKGFGPVQSDGSQYGFIQDGRIEPLSPFVPNEDNLRHLADRAYEYGDLATNDEIRRALNVRRAEGIDQQLEDAYNEKNRGNYDGGYDDDYEGYYDEDGEYYGPPQIQTRDDVKANIDDYLSGRYTGNGELGQARPPEIEIRDQAGNPGYNTTPYEPTGEDIRQFREQQVAALGIPSGARAQIDVINNYSPRPIPTRITVEDLQAERNAPYRGGWTADTPFEAVTASGMEPRRQQLINSIRENQSGISATGYQHDPSVVRDALKRRAVVQATNPEPGALGMIRQEHYTPRDVEALREWQAVQAQNWPVAPPLRTPPPTLNPDGTVASRRPAPEGALDNSGTHLSLLTGREQIIPGTTVLNRRMLTPEQEQAAQDLARAGRTPALVDQNLSRLNSWFDGTRSGRLFQEITGANSEADLIGSARPREMTSDRLRRDLALLERGVTQPGSVERDALGQAVADLRALQQSNYGSLGTEINRLQGVMNQANYGPASQHRQFQIDPPAPAAQDDPFFGGGGGGTLEAFTSGRRRARRRPSSFDDAPEPEPPVRPSVQVDPNDAFVRPTGKRAVKPQGFLLRSPAPETLEALERGLVGY